MDLSNPTVRSQAVQKVAQIFNRIKWLIVCSPLLYCLQSTGYQQRKHLAVPFICPFIWIDQFFPFLISFCFPFFPFHQASQWVSQSSQTCIDSCGLYSNTHGTVHACSIGGEYGFPFSSSQPVGQSVKSTMYWLMWPVHPYSLYTVGTFRQSGYHFQGPRVLNRVIPANLGDLLLSFPFDHMIFANFVRLCWNVWRRKLICTVLSVLNTACLVQSWTG